MKCVSQNNNLTVDTVMFVWEQVYLFYESENYFKGVGMSRGKGDRVTRGPVFGCWGGGVVVKMWVS